MGIIPNSAIYFPYVDFQLGNLNVTRDASGVPDRLLSFNCTRKSESGAGNFNIRLLDPEWVVVETEIFRNNFECCFRYGWYSHDGDKRIGPIYYGKILTVKENLTSKGTELEISGSSSGISFDPHKRKGYGGDSNAKISDIALEICLENNWIPDIEETRSYPANDINETGGGEKIFCRNDETGLQFLHRISQYAVSKNDDRGDYIVYLDNARNPNILHFRPRDKSKQPKLREFYFSFDSTSEVLSWRPELDLSSMLLQGTKHDVEGQAPDHRGDIKEKVEGYHELDIPDPGTLVSDGSWYGRIVKGKQYSSEHEAELWSIVLKSKAPMNTKATMEILADPTVLVGSNCIVYVQIPGNIYGAKLGSPHTSSGQYFILEIVDQMQGASFTSTLTLVRATMGNQVVQDVTLLSKPG